MVAWSLMSNNFVLHFHELDNFKKHLEHIYLVFQHIIFISLDSSIFPLRIEQTVFCYHSLYPSYGLLCSTDT